MNGADEMSASINWQQQQCSKTNDSSCRLFRDVIIKKQKEKTMQILKFTSLCDSIWDLRNGSDEMDCNEWVCEPGYDKQQSNQSRWSGNCINATWQCNRIWDYTDGSDEYECNYTEPYPIPHCSSLITGEIILLNQSNAVAGDGHVDCLGGVDERVTFACSDGFPLNERFLCNNNMTCLEPMYVCNHVNDCSDGEDESEFWCGVRPSFNSSVCKPKTFACQERNDSGPCIPQADRCHDERQSCLHSHRDKYMCIQPRKYNDISRKNVSLSAMEYTQSNLIPPWYCDRGLVVFRYGKPACLCPPSFYGHRCEKHSHRLTVIFTLNRNRIRIRVDLLRIQVLLINHNETIDHILLTQHPLDTIKHRLYLNYPRSLYSDLRNASSSYIVQFRLYAINNSAVRLFTIKEYPIKYPFYRPFVLLSL
jgi:hypothetical protein